MNEQTDMILAAILEQLEKLNRNIEDMMTNYGPSGWALRTANMS